MLSTLTLLELLTRMQSIKRWLFVLLHTLSHTHTHTRATLTLILLSTLSATSK